MRPDAVSMPISVRSVELSQIGGAAAAGKAPRESARTAAAQETLEAFIGSSSRWSGRRYGSAAWRLIVRTQCCPPSPFIRAMRCSARRSAAI